MSTTNADTTTEEPHAQNGTAYSYHVEPPAQGGERYARCRGCGREILTRIGTDRLEHAPGCPNA